MKRRLTNKGESPYFHNELIMIFVNARWWDCVDYIWECETLTYDRRTVLAACDCGFESGCIDYDFIYMGF